MIDWLFLLAAILLEVAGTTCMKLSEGFTRTVPSLLIFLFYGLAFSALNMSLRSIEIGIAYAIWAGLGTVLIAAIGIAWFREEASIAKIGFLALVIIGVIGLQLSSGGPAAVKIEP